MKQIIAILLFLAVALGLAACGVPAPAESVSGTAAASADPTPAAETPAAAEEAAAPAPADEAPAAEEQPAEPSPTPPRPLGVISDEQARLNRFLTSIVQQDIVNTQTDLDDDAEMVRFVFRFRETNDPSSVLEQNDGNALCRTLTLEQVNETLSKLFGKSISPDREDYSVSIDETEVFHCFYRDGVFWNVPPFPAERYPFRIRFALVNKIDYETYTLHFRLYRANPWIWGENETERHIGVLPYLNFTEAEGSDVISYIGEGVAILRDFGPELQLVEMAGKVTR